LWKGVKPAEDERGDGNTKRNLQKYERKASKLKSACKVIKSIARLKKFIFRKIFHYLKNYNFYE